MISLSESFEKLTNLNDLSISVYQQNNISVQGAQVFGDNLKHLINLQNLSLSIYSNPIEGEGSLKLVLGIQQLKKLKSLKLDLINVELQFQDIVQIINNLPKLDLNMIQFKLMINGEELYEQKKIDYNHQLATLQDSIKPQQDCQQMNILQIGKRSFVQNYHPIIEKLRKCKKKLKIDVLEMFQLYQIAGKGYNSIDLLKLKSIINLKLIMDSNFNQIGKFNLVSSLDLFGSISKLSISINQNFIVNDLSISNISSILKKLNKIRILALDIFSSSKMSIRQADQIIEALKDSQDIKRIKFMIEFPQAYQFIGVLNYLKYNNQEDINIFYDRICYFKRDSITKEVSELDLGKIIHSSQQSALDYQHLKESFKYLTSLVFLNLDLEHTCLKEDCLVAIGQGFKYLTNLLKLQIKLGFQNIDDIQFKEFIQDISYCKLIKKISFGCDSPRLSVVYLQSLFEILGNLQFLSTLKMEFTNPMSNLDENSQLILKLIRITYIKKLFIKINHENFGINGMQVFQGWFKQLTSLNTLSFETLKWNSDVHNMLCQQLVNNLKYLVNLQSLAVNYNSNDINPFFYKLNGYKLTKLRQIHIYNLISEQNSPTIFNFCLCIKQFTHLQKLVIQILCNDEMYSKKYESFQNTLQSLTTLKQVTFTLEYYAYHKIQKQIIYFSRTLVNMQSLQILSFYENGKAIQGTPLNLIKKKNKRLVLCNCQINRRVLKRIYAYFLLYDKQFNYFYSSNLREIILHLIFKVLLTHFYEYFLKKGLFISF